MLDAIKDGLNSVLDFFTLIWDFVTGLIDDIVNLTTTVTETVKNIPDYFSWLPAEIVVSIVALFGIVVVYKILGREG